MDATKVLQDKIIQQQEDALQLADIDPALKERIRLKYLEYAKLFPHMKRHRLMRKAGEFFHVQFNFE